jgi:hypothetical protein
MDSNLPRPANVLAQAEAKVEAVRGDVTKAEQQVKAVIGADAAIVKADVAAVKAGIKARWLVVVFAIALVIGFAVGRLV